MIGLVAVPMLAQAECGWLLMMPRAKPSESLSKWEQMGVFDAAEACESARREEIRRDYAAAEIIVRSNPSGNHTRVYQASALVHAARCFPAGQVPVR